MAITLKKEPGAEDLESCFNCRFSFRSSSLDPQIVCRRYAPPPQVFEYGSKRALCMKITVWPPVEAENWCGQYERRKS